MKFVIAVLITRLASCFFIVAGIYALMHGFMKTGGFLIAGGIFSMCFIVIRTSNDDKEESSEPRLPL
jgi:hypothetical protein